MPLNGRGSQAASHSLSGCMDSSRQPVVSVDDAVVMQAYPTLLGRRMARMAGLAGLFRVHPTDFLPPSTPKPAPGTLHTAHCTHPTAPSLISSPARQH